jgi:hypothetical protein
MILVSYGNLLGSFTMCLLETWLNNSVLDTSKPVRDCRECSDAAQYGSIEFLNVGQCSIRSCDTTCRISSKFNNSAKDEQCYPSFCALPDNEQFKINLHRVDIEGIIYHDQQDRVELWNVDVYCRASNCSQQEIFNELHANLIVQTINMSIIFDNGLKSVTDPSLICYDCYCCGALVCNCTKSTVSYAQLFYCINKRESFSNHTVVNLWQVDCNSTYVYIQEFPLILAEQSIIDDSRGKRWNTRTNLVIFECNWDYSNYPEYISLPFC